MSSTTMQRSRSLPLTLRDLHSNISAFIAPVVVFYAISGALQIFDLHESHGGYNAPAFIASMGRLHNNQVFAPPPARASGGPRRPGAGGSPPNAAAPSLATQSLKWLFLLEALGLATTTVLGAWIGVTHAKRKPTIVALLIAGTVLPLLLVIL